MRKIHIFLMSFAIISLLLVGCGKSTNPVEVPGSDYNEITSLAKATSIRVPFSQLTFVPCAAGGAGEAVLLSGTLHIVSNVTIDANGGFHCQIHFQPQGATGTGQTTGVTYRTGGETRQSLNISGQGLPSEFTFVNNFKIIGPGPNNNLLVHDTIHATLDANGNPTADVNNTSVECR